MDPNEFRDKPVRLQSGEPYRSLSGAVPTDGGWRLFLSDDDGRTEIRDVAVDELDQLEVLREDGAADPARALAGMWAQWMHAATVDARATVLATSPLRPYAHQNNAVYGAMLPQPRLRFLLADEPGTGKTIMAGMYLREMQRLGGVGRALVIAPAHLVTKWQEDFRRFFGGGLKRITNQTVQEGALAVEHDLWVVSLDLAARNRQVQEAIRPDLASWDVVVIDEAHRLTPSAERYYDVGHMICTLSRQVLLMTATPHRGKEWLFRNLMNLVDPELFPPAEESDDPRRRQLKPPKTHFLRRMKEDLRDHDGITPLFKGRRAANLPVPLNPTERTYYNEALDLVEQFFPADARPLARIVYGKRAASSLAALAETLRRRRNRMGSGLPAEAAATADPEGEDEELQDEARVLVEKSTSAKAERAAIDEVLTRLDPVVADPATAISKWPRVVDECLTGNGITPGAAAQAVVFTEYTDTAWWLADRFTRVGYAAATYTGADSHHERDRVRDRFAAGGFQLLVSTDAGNEGIDLQTAHVLINWDIPWSLVRLEQRMGRIHRVGQTHSVELYNLIATDTREGEVLHRLLDNFVTAANRLEGQMFDSLSAVAELADIDLPEQLRRTYRPDGTQTFEAPGADELERLARDTRAREAQLSTSVDFAAAVAELHNQALERVNPRIVESFLRRLADSGHLTVRPSAAGPGLFDLQTPNRDVARALGGRNVMAATSDDAVAEARRAGADVDDAAALGPSEDAFRHLVEAVAGDTAADLQRGTVLADPSTTTDYAVFCYDADATDGHGRTRRWPLLVRVDDVGSQPLAWPSLANLKPADAEAREPHPAWRAAADDEAAAAVHAEAERRRDAVRQWLNDSRQEWKKLPRTLSDALADHDKRRQERQRLDSEVAERLRHLEQIVDNVRIDAPRLLGWALVQGTAESADEHRDSERIAVAHVTQVLREHGWHTRDLQEAQVGYDIYAARGREHRLVEVKGVLGEASSDGVRLTGNELLVAQQHARDYWLYVVDRCADGHGRLYAAYPDPYHLFKDQMRHDVVTPIPGSALAAHRTEELPT